MLDAPHFCPEWDYMWIRPGEPEMECCVCTSREEAPKAEDDGQ